MADNVVIDFSSQTKEIDTAIEKLEKMGKVDKANADQFKKSNQEYQDAARKRKQLLDIEIAALEKTKEKLKKAFDPKDIESFNAAINESKKRIALLKGEVDKTDGGLKKLTGTLKDVGAAIGIAFGVQQIIQFGREAAALAAKGEGIRTAFARIGDDAALQKLRIATRGATSDIDLMAAALRGANFGISTDLLAKGLELAGKVSRQTGQDVTYLTNSFVDGLGRKSIRILDNLQLNIAELQVEIKKTGDFNTAVSNSITKRLAEIGEVAETTADRNAQFSASFDNLKEKVGGFITQAGQPFVDIGTGIVDVLGFALNGFRATGDEVDNFTDSLGHSNEQLKRFEQITTNLRIQQLNDQIALLNKSGTTVGIEELTKELDKLQKKLNEGAQTGTVKSLFALEQKLQELKEIFSGLEIGSDLFNKTKTEIENLEAEIDRALGKEDERAKKLNDLRKKQDLDRFKAGQEAQEEANKIAEEMLKENEDVIRQSGRRKVFEAKDNASKRLQAEINLIDDETNIKIQHAQFEIENEKLLEDTIYNIQAEANERKKKLIDDDLANRLKAAKERTDLYNDQVERELELEDKRAEELRRKQEEQDEIFIGGVESVIGTVDQIRRDALQDRLDDELGKIEEQRDAELEALELQFENEEISREELEKRKKQINEDSLKAEKAIKRQVAIDEKNAAVFRASIELFLAIAEENVTKIIAATGALAAIVAEPLPKFKKGTDFLQRGNNPAGEDTIPILANEGERIVPTDINKQLSGISNKDLPRLVALGKMNEKEKKIKVDAELNPYDFKRAMKGTNKDVVTALYEVKKAVSERNSSEMELRMRRAV